MFLYAFIILSPFVFICNISSPSSFENNNSSTSALFIKSYSISFLNLEFLILLLSFFPCYLYLHLYFHNYYLHLMCPFSSLTSASNKAIFSPSVETIPTLSPLKLKETLLNSLLLILFYLPSHQNLYYTSL